MRLCVAVRVCESVSQNLIKNQVQLHKPSQMSNHKQQIKAALAHTDKAKAGSGRLQGGV